MSGRKCHATNIIYYGVALYMFRSGREPGTE